MHPLALLHFDEVEDKKTLAVINELTAGYDNKAQYFYHIYEHWVDKEGKSHPKKRMKKDQYGKDQIAFSLMIKADDKDRIKDWLQVFSDIQKDQSELAEQLHDPEKEKLFDKSESDFETDVDSDPNEKNMKDEEDPF